MSKAGKRLLKAAGGMPAIARGKRSRSDHPPAGQIRSFDQRND
jgi:hypothetical protein